MRRRLHAGNTFGRRARAALRRPPAAPRQRLAAHQRHAASRRHPLGACGSVSGCRTGAWWPSKRPTIRCARCPPAPTSRSAPPTGSRASWLAATPSTAGKRPPGPGGSELAAPWLAALTVRAVERLPDAALVESALGDADRGLVGGAPDEAGAAALTQSQRALLTCVRGEVKAADLIRSVGPTAARDLLALLCSGAIEWAGAAAESPVAAPDKGAPAARSDKPTGRAASDKAAAPAPPASTVAARGSRPRPGRRRHLPRPRAPLARRLPLRPRRCRRRWRCARRSSRFTPRFAGPPISRCSG